MGNPFQGRCLISHPDLFLCTSENFPRARLPTQGTCLFGQAIGSGFLSRKDTASFPHILLRKPPGESPAALWGVLPWALCSLRGCPEPFIHSFIHPSIHPSTHPSIFKCLLSELFELNTVLVVGEHIQLRASTGAKSTGVMERRVPIWDQLEDRKQLA